MGPISGMSFRGALACPLPPTAPRNDPGTRVGPHDNRKRGAWRTHTPHVHTLCVALRCVTHAHTYTHEGRQSADSPRSFGASRPTAPAQYCCA